jgi:PAS domain S-box-containing protein
MRVLVIDDNPDHRELIITKVKREFPEAEFIEVVRPPDLARALNSEAVDLVLTDYRLQWSDGLKVLRLLQDRMPRVPVVMVTDTGSEEIAAAGMKAGLSDYVLKGHLNRLPLVVRESLDKARLRRENEEARERLRISEERYRFVSELCSDFAYASRLEEDGTETCDWMMEAFGRLTGLDPADFSRSNCWRGIVVPEDVAIIDERIRTLRSGRASIQEFRIRTKSGEVRYLRDSCRAEASADDSGALRLIGAAQDVTDRKTAEIERSRRLELETRERHYRSLAEVMPQIVFTAGPDGNLDYFNSRWHEYTGLSFEESQGWGWRNAVHPDDYDASVDRWIHAVQQREPVETELRLRRSDGSHRLHLIRAIPLEEDNETVAKWVGTCTDVEDQRRAAEELRQTQKLESIGLLAGGIAHDFNNLLTGILGNLSLAIDDMPDETDSIRELLVEALQASERAADLTRQLLAYSGKGRFYVQPVNLSDVVREITALLKSSIPRKVNLHLELANGLPVVEADAVQMQQLIMNLVINAAEAIDPRTGGAVEIRTEAVKVNGLQLAGEFGDEPLQPGEYVLLEVIDDGCGMTEEVKSRIFEPFFTTKFTGRGLGMAAALGIVRGHHGAIYVESAPGQGSRFRLLFPALGTRQSAKTPASEPVDLKGTGLILVADDEEVIRRLARNALERFGYQVLIAEDGRVAVDQYRQCHAELALVLLDMTMPVLNGEEALVAMREIDPTVPVIASSGHNEVIAIQKFAGRGIASFLQKPYTGAQLAERVKRVLEDERSGRKKTGSTAN